VTREAAALDALARGAGLDPQSIVALAGDVGRRRYFRLTLPDNRAAIGVAYPPEEEDSRRRWVAARECLEGRVRVPALVADDGKGHQIVEDLGSEDLSALFATRPQDRAEWLARAVDAAASIAAMPDPGVNAPFDAALFRRELDLAREAVFELLLGEPLSPRDRAAHDEWADSLVHEVLGHPFALCHRDYHANNLFPAGEGVALIDFQDLRSGPDSYDLASLLWERTTLSWMTEGVAGEATARFAARCGADAGAFSSRLSRVLLQRAWKVCGTFARAIARQKGEAYRAYLPGELALVRRLLGASEPDRRFDAVLAARCGALC
jgi:aminoglycoside/choline kinase family phosphotransferase